MSTEILMQDFKLILPEILLCGGALLTLIIGLFNNKAITLLSYISVVFIVLALYMLDINYTENELAFKGAFISNEYTTIIKAFLLIFMAFSSLLIAKSNIKNIAFEVYPLLLLSATGMCIMVSAYDIFLAYLGLELMSLPLYILVTTGSGSSSHSNEAGLKFFILGALSSCLYLFGLSIVYGFAAGTSFEAIGQYYISIANIDIIEFAVPTAFLVGLVLILSAFLFKVSAAPFHMWTPDVYQGAPTFITMILSSAPKLAAIAVLLNILYEPFFDLVDQWKQVIILCAIASLFIGSLGGLIQHNFKRMLAYSTISHIGFVLIGISLGELISITAALNYTFIYLFMSLLVFAVLLYIENDSNYNGNMSEIRGFGRSHPFLAFALTVGLLSMAGLPPFAGFFAKFYILITIIDQELYALAIVAIIAAVISCYYYLRVIKIMYFDASHKLELPKISVTFGVVITLMLLFNIGYIISPDIFYDIAKRAIETLTT